MPSSQDLPDDLTKLARRNALEISDTRFNYDVDHLIGIMDKVLSVSKTAPKAPQPAPRRISGGLLAGIGVLVLVLVVVIGLFVFFAGQRGIVGEEVDPTAIAGTIVANITAEVVPGITQPTVDLEAAVASTVAATEQAQAEAEQPVEFATDTPPPTATPELPTATVPTIPSLKTLTDLNIRSGPGFDYDLIGLLPSETSAEISGRSEDQQWWQIRFALVVEGVGWVSADPAYSTTTNVDGVPIVAAPPLPPTPTSLPENLPNSQPFEPEMILIPAGEFLMGSDPSVDKDTQDNEQPQHRLYLPDYYVAKTPVTNAQYAAFVEVTGHEPPAHWEDGQPPSDKLDHPVVNVSWHDAVAYCKWLSEATGRIYRLPTEAEWEKAARGADGWIYPWGNQWDKTKLNSVEGGQVDTTPVGQYSPNGDSPYGVADMAGNVWEWTATKWQKPYPYDVDEDEWTAGYLEGSESRVLRGGSWYDGQFDARCTSRYDSDPNVRDDDFGLRLVSPIK